MIKFECLNFDNHQFNGSSTNASHTDPSENAQDVPILDHKYVWMVEYAYASV